MDFISAVNRMLRHNGLIRGDTDPLVTFADTSHNSTSQLAQIAVQSEIAELSSRGLLPYQHTIQATLSMVTSTRSYALPAAFIQLWGNPPFSSTPRRTIGFSSIRAARINCETTS